MRTRGLSSGLRRTISRAVRSPASRFSGTGKSGRSNWAAVIICAPAQLVGDFIAGRPSTSLGSVEPSYKPGVHLTDLTSALPEYVVEAIREALPQIDKKIPGFAMHDAVLTGVETRTSSPIRVRRKDDYQSVNVEGFIPRAKAQDMPGAFIRPRSMG